MRRESLHCSLTIPNQKNKIKFLASLQSNNLSLISFFFSNSIFSLSLQFPFESHLLRLRFMSAESQHKISLQINRRQSDMFYYLNLCGSVPLTRDPDSQPFQLLRDEKCLWAKPRAGCLPPCHH